MSNNGLDQLSSKTIRTLSIVQHAKFGRFEPAKGVPEQL
jgi:hypothetical protein